MSLELEKGDAKVQSVSLDVQGKTVESNEDNGLTEEEKNHVTEKNLDDYYDFDYNIRYISLEKLTKELESILEEVK